MEVDTDRRKLMASVAAGVAATATGTAVAQDDEELSVDVTMYDGSYVMDPIGLYVEPGDTVTFNIDEGAPHSTTAYEDRIPEGAEPWNSGNLDQGETYEVTFEEEGTYDYFCLPHVALGQVGRIVVGEPGGPAEGDAPDGELPSADEIVEQGSISYPVFIGDETPDGEGTAFPLTVPQLGFGAVGLLLILGTGFVFSEKNKGEDGNNALAVGLASLVLGVLLILGVVFHLVDPL